MQTRWLPLLPLNARGAHVHVVRAWRGAGEDASEGASLLFAGIGALFHVDICKHRERQGFATSELTL